jgi:hypothetical protein
VQWRLYPTGLKTYHNGSTTAVALESFRAVQAYPASENDGLAAQCSSWASFDTQSYAEKPIDEFFF